MYLSLFSQILASLKVGTLVFDREERLRMSNAWFDRHAGWSYSPTYATFTELFPELVNGRSHLALRQALDHGISSLLSHKLNRTPFPLNHRSGPQAGVLLDQLTEVTPLTEENGTRWALVAVHDQSTAVQAERVLRAQQEELRRYSFVDGLTEIPNRRRFDQYLVDELRSARRHQSTLALMLFDVDQFKSYNDLRGHMEGDACLRKIAQIAAAQVVRATDLVARYGGEEFAVVLPDTDLDGAVTVAERIREAIEGAHITHPGSSVGPYVTVSAGVSAIKPTVEPDRLALLVAVDQLLYRAKREGRNRTVAEGLQHG
jgi:diguanylate cyclase (GGDEF)-like protein